MLENLLLQIDMPAQLDPLLILAMLLLAGAGGGWVATRMHLPSITGNILAGALIGPAGLELISGKETIEALQPISAFAMGLITVAIGGHLSWRRIHNALRRIGLIAFGEISATLALVSLAMYMMTGDWIISILLGIMATETAPATIVHVVRESRAKGPFVKTLLSTVAIDNIVLIVMFAVFTNLIAMQLMAPEHAAERVAWVQPLWHLLGALVLGLVLGRITEHLVRRPQFHNFSTVFVAILVASGLSRFLGISPLLTPLVLGIYLANSSKAAEEQFTALNPIEPLLYIGFFTLAGVTIHLDALGKVGLLGLVYVVARIAGKVLGAGAGSFLAGSSRRIGLNLPIALMPHAGLAIALVVLLQGNENLPQELRYQVSTLVLAAAVFNEIIGPIFTRLALKWSREENKDRRRLVDFIQEEFIKTNLKAEDKWDAIRQLSDFLIRTHKVEHVHPDDLYRSVVERERDDSTAIGKGAAIPHGVLEEGPSIQGVLGICPDGIDWEAADGRRVQIVMLIVTPRNHQEQHLQVLASLAAMISDEVIRSRLIRATDANEAWEIIEGEETPDYNYFIED